MTLIIALFVLCINLLINLNYGYSTNYGQRSSSEYHVQEEQADIYENDEGYSDEIGNSKCFYYLLLIMYIKIQ